MAVPEFVIVGRVRRAHGLRGEVVVESITDEPAAVFAAGRRVLVGTTEGEPDTAAGELRVIAQRPFKEGMILVHFEGIGDRSAAERWRDRFLLVPGDELAPLGEGEAYVHELHGMAVELQSGERVGSVRDVFELPQGYLVEVERDTGNVMIPLQEVFLVQLDRAGRRIVVSLPEGMLE